jgi:hypothetical protein
MLSVKPYPNSVEAVLGRLKSKEQSWVERKVYNAIDTIGQSYQLFDPYNTPDHSRAVFSSFLEEPKTIAKRRGGSRGSAEPESFVAFPLFFSSLQPIHHNRPSHQLLAISECDL